MSKPAITIKIDDSGLKRFLRQLQGMTNTAPLMRKLAGIMHDAVEENFAQEGRPRWQPLAVATLFAGKKSSIVGKKGRFTKGFEKRLKGRKILQDTAALAGSITSSYDARSAVVGSNKKYAAIHQFGGKAGRGLKVTIPARPFLSLGQDNIEEMEDTIIGFLKVNR